LYPPEPPEEKQPRAKATWVGWSDTSSSKQDHCNRSVSKGAVLEVVVANPLKNVPYVEIECTKCGDKGVPSISKVDIGVVKEKLFGGKVFLIFGPGDMYVKYAGARQGPPMDTVTVNEGCKDANHKYPESTFVTVSTKWREVRSAPRRCYILRGVPRRTRTL